MNELTNKENGNILIEKLESKSYKQLANDFTKSLNTFKKSSGMTALTLYLMLNKIEDKKERADVVKNIMEETGLSKSSISQLVKAGGYIYNNPDCLTLGSTACYKLAKEDDKTEDGKTEDDKTEDSKTEDINDVDNTDNVDDVDNIDVDTDEDVDLDLYSITFESAVWHDIYIATAKSKNENVQELRRFIKNSLGL